LSYTGLAVVFAGCATAATLDSTNDAYVHGLESYSAGHCAQARESLVKFRQSSCSSGTPGSGCQRATWMEVQCDLKEDRPAEAIVASNELDRLGPPRPELDPPLRTLRERAIAALRARWLSPETPVKLVATFRDDTGGRYSLDSISMSVDLLPASHAPPATHEWIVLQTSLPPGDHFVTLTARFRGKVRGGSFQMTTRSAQTFLSKPGETIRIAARTYLRDDLPLAAPPDLLAVDFDVTPASAKP
jgi:hypothetical protein